MPLRVNVIVSRPLSESVPKIRRTAVRYTTLGVDLTDVRLVEVERSGSRNDTYTRRGTEYRK